jgi:hypothetical protein
MKHNSVLVFLVLIPAALYAQNTVSYLIPRVVFVGDPAVLVLPLPELKSEAADIILTQHSPGFPFDFNIDFHRIVLERHLSGSRLMIEFTAFAPGYLEIPIIEIDGERFSNLSIRISSVVDPAGFGLELSGPASTLAMPGTAFMIFTFLSIFIILLIIVLWFVILGRRYLHGIILRIKLWKHFITIKLIEKKLHKLLLKDGDKRYILEKISDEFRMFLSFVTGINCRAMTAFELDRLQSGNGILHITENNNFLGNFFRRCDELRFSGRIATKADISGLLTSLRTYIVSLEKSINKKDDYIK